MALADIGLTLSLTRDERETFVEVRKRFAPLMEDIGVMQLARVDAAIEGDDYLAAILASEIESRLNSLPPSVRYLMDGGLS